MEVLSLLFMKLALVILSSSVHNFCFSAINFRVVTRFGSIRIFKKISACVF